MSDKIPLFKQATNIVQALQQAAERQEWKQVESAKARAERSPAARFGYSLTIPLKFESEYANANERMQHSELATLLNYAIRQSGMDAVIEPTLHDKETDFTLYTNHPKQVPFHVLKESVDRFRKEIAKDWTMRDGKLTRDFNLIGRDFFRAEPIVHGMIGRSLFKYPNVEFIKDGKAIHKVYPLHGRDDGKDRASVFEALMRDMCGIKDMSELPWDNSIDFTKFVMAGPTSAIPQDVANNLMTKVLGIAEQQGISARITIDNPVDIKRFGQDMGIDFSGKSPPH